MTCRKRREMKNSLSGVKMDHAIHRRSRWRRTTCSPQRRPNPRPQCEQRSCSFKYDLFILSYSHKFFPKASHSPLQRRSSTKASSPSSSSSAASTPPPSTPPTSSFLPLNLCINPKEQPPQLHNQLRQATIQNQPHHHQATISHEPKCSHTKFAYGCTRCPSLRR